MKTLFAFASIALALCVVGNPQHAAAQWPGATSHEPTLTAEFGGIAYDREGSSNSPLSVVDTISTEDVLSAEQGSDLGSAAGLQGKIIFPSRKTLQTFELRGSYTGWDEEAEIENANLDSPFFLGGIFQIPDQAEFDLATANNPILPIGVLDSDLSQAIIPITLNNGDVSTLSLVWPGLPASITADGVSPPALQDIFDINEVTSSYRSDYTSIELMSRRNTRPGVTWLFGPRFISIREQLEITTNGTSPTRIFQTPGVGFTDAFGFPLPFFIPVPFDQITPDGDGGFVDANDDPVTATGLPLDDDGNQLVFPIDSTGTVDATAASRTETQNSLIGLQIGLEYNMPVSQDIYFQLSGRGGLFFNSSTVDRAASPLRQISSTNSNDFATQESADASGESWLAEINIRGYVDLIPNTLSAYAGYDLLFIDQLVLAPNQTVAQDEVDQSGELFARGFSFGVKMNY